VLTATRIGPTRIRIYPSTTDTVVGDLDLIAIERAANGDGPVTLTIPEQVEAARLMDAHGVGLSEAAQRLGTAVARLQTWKSRGWTAPACHLQPPPKQAPCGTRGGYQRHLRRHERVCEPCKAANTADSIRQRRNRAAKKATVPA
jgi:hypothetical protein